MGDMELSAKRLLMGALVTKPRNRHRWKVAAGAVIALMTAVQGGQALAACGLCASSVTTNENLASCFLERYDDYAARSGTAVAVDLDDCPATRGVVEALSSPTMAQVVPDTRFMVTKGQLACFRERIEESLETGLDPATVIALDDCE